MLALGNQVISSQLSPEENSAISLPQSLFQNLNRTNSGNIGVFFGLYEMATLFPVSGGNIDSTAPSQLQVCSQVLAATVGQNMTIRDLEEPITAVLRLQIKEGMVSLSQVMLFRCL